MIISFYFLYFYLLKDIRPKNSFKNYFILLIEDRIIIIVFSKNCNYITILKDHYN